jgi:hypothetical protein
MSAPISLFRERLEQVGRRVRGRGTNFMAQCPNPDHGQGLADRHPSLHVCESAGGAVLCHCFAGCQLSDIRAPLRLTERDLFPNRTGYRAGRRRAAPKAHEIVIAGNCGELIVHPPKSVAGPDVPNLPPVLADVLRCLHEHAFFAPRCCPSQELVARETDYSRETVNRACAALRALGLIAWTQRLRPGARWRHNVYMLLSSWHRPNRRAAMARLARIRHRRGGLSNPDHTKSTARDVKDREDDQKAPQHAWRRRGRGHERPAPGHAAGHRRRETAGQAASAARNRADPDHTSVLAVE